jgi:phospholipid/cholesterol/gamma-HCH transport system substrate-binding protein
VGQVVSIGLDDSLRARVTLDVDPQLQLPSDTSAGIRTSGLLGDQFIALEPGAEEAMLGQGDEIAMTESALSIERLIGRFVHDSGVEEE